MAQGNLKALTMSIHMDTISSEVTFEWSKEKNKHLQNERGLSFEQVLEEIKARRVLYVGPHFNLDRYPHQSIIIVRLENYVHYVPFVIKRNVWFLKSIVPSRKLHKKYS